MAGQARRARAAEVAVDPIEQQADVESRLAELRRRRDSLQAGASDDAREQLAHGFTEIVAELYARCEDLYSIGDSAFEQLQVRAGQLFQEVWAWAAADPNPWVRRFAVLGLLHLLRWHRDDPLRVMEEVDAAGRTLQGPEVEEVADRWVEVLRRFDNAQADMGHTQDALAGYLQLQQLHGDSADPYMWLVLMRVTRDRAYLLADSLPHGQVDLTAETEFCDALLARWSEGSAPVEARWITADLLSLSCSVLSDADGVSSYTQAGDGSDGDGGSSRERVDDRPLTPADEAYAQAVWQLADRFGTDDDEGVRNVVLEAIAQQGQFHRSRQQLTASVAAYRRAFDLSVRQGNTWTGIARVGMNLGFVFGSLMRDEQAAVEQYGRLFAVLPDEALLEAPEEVAKAYASWLTMLERLMTRGELSSAVVDDAVVTRSEFLSLRDEHHRGTALAEAGDQDAAIRHYDRVLTSITAPAHPLMRRLRIDVLADRQLALHALRAKDEAVLVARQVLAEFGDEVMDLDMLKTMGQVLHNATIALSDLDRPGEAIEFYDALIDRWEDAAPLQSLAAKAVKALREKGITLQQDLDRPAEALACFERAFAHVGSAFSQVRVEAAYAASNLAQLLRLHAGDSSAAVQVIEDCRERIGDEPGEDFDEARTYLERQLALAQESLAAQAEPAAGRRLLRWPWGRK